MKISFSGCGFLGVYHIGVAKCLVEKAPEFVDSLDGFYGASAGSLVAVMLCCRVGQDGGPRFAKKMSDLVRQSYFGPLSPKFDPSGLIVRDLGRYLPPDAHKRCTNKVKISVTNCSGLSWSNLKITEFNTRRELLNAVVGSCFIPVWSGWTLPTYRGKKICDGGFTNNIPGCNNPDVITVCPFSGESDICPQDDSCHPEHTILATNTSFSLSASNIQRLKESLFPPPWEKLELLMSQGYQDAYRFLCSRGIVSKPVDIGIPLKVTPSSSSGEEVSDEPAVSPTLCQVLYELPLVNKLLMSTPGTNQLPSVPPTKMHLYRSIRHPTALWYYLLTLPSSQLIGLWCKCVSILGSVYSWKLALLLQFMRLLKLAMKKGGILAKDNRLLFLTDSQHVSVITAYRIVPISTMH